MFLVNVYHTKYTKAAARGQLITRLWSRNSNFWFHLQLRASEFFGSNSGSNIWKFLAPTPERFASLKSKIIVIVL